jgi:hypothetical protein
MAVMKEPVTIMEKETDTWTTGTEHMCEPKQKLDVNRLTQCVSPLINDAGTVVHLGENEIYPLSYLDRKRKSR